MVCQHAVGVMGRYAEGGGCEVRVKYNVPGLEHEAALSSQQRAMLYKDH